MCSFGVIYRSLIAGCVIAVLAGCDGSPPLSAGPSANAASRTASRNLNPGQALLYVSNWKANDVLVVKYPQGGVTQTLKNKNFSQPWGLCSDSSGDVFVSNIGSDDVIEYAHGGKTPTATLQVPGSAVACSVDPTTGNLAVIVYPNSGGEGIAVFPDASGTPTMHWMAPGSVFWFCGYDGSGNLFIDGQSQSQRVNLWELPAGGSGFLSVQINGGELYEVGQVQWDGSYITIEDRDFQTISRMAISANPLSPNENIATFVSVTGFGNCGHGDGAWQTWIYDGTLIVPCEGKLSGFNVNLYDYPSGSKLKRIVRGMLDTYYRGVTISVAPSR